MGIGFGQELASSYESIQEPFIVFAFHFPLLIWPNLAPCDFDKLNFTPWPEPTSDSRKFLRNIWNFFPYRMGFEFNRPEIPFLKYSHFLVTFVRIFFSLSPIFSFWNLLWFNALTACRVLSLGVLRSMARWKFTNIWEEHVASIFRAQEAKQEISMKLVVNRAPSLKMEVTCCSLM
jgi:hypothetical protein